jgi:cobalamin biosynthesis protein CobT
MDDLLVESVGQIVERNVDGQTLCSEVVRQELGDVGVVESNPSEVVEPVDDEDEGDDCQAVARVASVGKRSGKAHDEGKPKAHPSVRRDPHEPTSHALTVRSRGQRGDHVESSEPSVQPGHGERVGDADIVQDRGEVVYELGSFTSSRPTS